MFLAPLMISRTSFIFIIYLTTQGCVYLRDTISVLGMYESKCFAGESPASFVPFFGASKYPHTMVKTELSTHLMEDQHLTQIYFLDS